MLSTTAHFLNKAPSLVQVPKPFIAVNSNDQLHVNLLHNSFRPSVPTIFSRKQLFGHECVVVFSTKTTRRRAQKGVRASLAERVSRDTKDTKPITLKVTLITQRRSPGLRKTIILLNKVVPYSLYTTVDRFADAYADTADTVDYFGHLVKKSLEWVGSLFKPHREPVPDFGTLDLMLCSPEFDPNKLVHINGTASNAKKTEEEATFEAVFELPSDFGEVAVVVITKNRVPEELYLSEIVLEFPKAREVPIRFTCNSWLNPQQTWRIFFNYKSCLPSETPSGLEKWRKTELNQRRGGEGLEERELKDHDRIYDYDTYNDLGDPDNKTNNNLARPVLGDACHPYPRRCKTGRARCESDPRSETRTTEDIYVPRDEQFSDLKLLRFKTRALGSGILGKLQDTSQDTFPSLEAIDGIFQKSYGSVQNVLELIGVSFSYVGSILRRLVIGFKDKDVVFEAPPLFKHRDRAAWCNDGEFARQTLAGVNPCTIKLLKKEDWPLESKLNEADYGPKESAITKELDREEVKGLMKGQMKGLMTVEEAIEKKRLFILDYHDALLPYVNKVREIKGTTLYGSRTLFMLTDSGTLTPLAIELTRPPCKGKPQWKGVYTPSSKDYAKGWLWRLAKVHVLAHDSGYHQLISHWLRTHCCTEPYIIATNRHLSVIHPIYRLLHPHFRYTMAINARARKALINADGIIETTFSPGKYSMEISSAIYGKEWRFDREALPEDLKHRGMASEDPSKEHGLDLAIEDYPYANDGLLIWDAIKQWVQDYVNFYYREESSITKDEELKAWWKEIRTRGHEDKKNAPWWPSVEKRQDLIQILTTIIWVASGHHTAVNFGQYDYAGYFPNRPTIARTNMPDEDLPDGEWKSFTDEQWKKVLLECFPSPAQAIKVISVLDLLSTHSPDEVYLGLYEEQAWKEEEDVHKAFTKFKNKLKDAQKTIDENNKKKELKNRGAGILPYDLLKPDLESENVKEGLPTSISI